MGFATAIYLLELLRTAEDVDESDRPKWVADAADGTKTVFGPAA